jgi:glycosyltransferase involved in cell wall biosynthesis
MLEIAAAAGPTSRRGERRAALLIAMSTVAAGVAVGRRPALSRLVSGASAVVPALAVMLAVASRRRPFPRYSGARPATSPGLVRIVIPARDEAAVIGDVIADLAGQDARDGSTGRAMEIVIVDDRSSDGTGAVAQAAIDAAGLEGIARVVRRPDGGGGKGAALAFADAEEAAVPASGGLVIVLDADARIGPGFVRLAAASFSGRLHAASARRRMLMPKTGRLPRLLARLQDDEQTVDGEIQLGRHQLDAGSDLRGDGMIVGPDALAAVGGWPSAALCEDLELASRLYLRCGIAARWLPALEVWEQPVTALGALIRQRARWAEGAVRRDLRVTLPALIDLSIPARRRFAVGLYAAQTLVPLFVVGTVLGGRRGQRTAIARTLGLSYGLAALGIAFDALRRAHGPDGRPVPLAQRGARSAGVTVFGLLWVVLGPLAWLRVAARRGPPAFSHTEHRGSFEPPEFAPGRQPERCGSGRPRR